MPQVKPSIKVLKLNPYYPFRGVFRFNGRLAHANLPSKAKYQQLVPKESGLDTLHGGPNKVMTKNSSNF